jgi:hypothetical protein
MKKESATDPSKRACLALQAGQVRGLPKSAVDEWAWAGGRGDTGGAGHG